MLNKIRIATPRHTEVATTSIIDRIDIPHLLRFTTISLTISIHCYVYLSQGILIVNTTPLLPIYCIVPQYTVRSANRNAAVAPIASGAVPPHV